LQPLLQQRIGAKFLDGRPVARPALQWKTAAGLHPSAARNHGPFHAKKEMPGVCLPGTFRRRIAMASTPHRKLLLLIVIIWRWRVKLIVYR
jgi:hypothetical protein